MRSLRRILLALVLSLAASAMVKAQEKDTAPPAAKETEPLPEEYSCMFCHGSEGTLAEADDTKHLVITEEHLLADIHWQKGLRCHDCHGGSPILDDYTDHRDDSTFQERVMVTPADIPKFCGRCHSDLEYMRRYAPSSRTDQEAEYRTSGHGKRLRKAREEHEKALEAHKEKGGEGEPPAFQDPNVATCISCHGKHGILAVNDQNSPVYAGHVAETCSHCHSDKELMADLTYGDPPRLIGYRQYDRWRESVHGKAMLEKGDMSAPTCNDCHGNHGAMPPGVDSVANACGNCHGKVAKLFAETSMKHKFEEAGLPGCAQCHGNHQTLSPTDEMLGMQEGGVCAECHEKNQHGATVAGAEAARAMREGLDDLKREIAEAEKKIKEAERLGMEVRGPRFDLRQAFDALTNARSMIHSFAWEPVQEALDEGLEVTGEVKGLAEAALAEHTYRRVWLGATLVPIGIVIVLLLLYIRSLPMPSKSTYEKGAS
ncbi:MAG: cytochrome c3 family protein [Planctomycetota bacterium]